MKEECMKKTFSIIALMIIVCIVAVSCETDRSHATMRVILQKDRSIVPSDYSLEIARYKITGTGPSGASFEVETSKESVSLEGLIIGEWHLAAEGMNANGDVLVTGETTHRLSSSNGSAIISLETLVGEGNLSVVFTWDAERLGNYEPRIEVSLTPQYGDRSEKELTQVSFNKIAGTAEYSGEALPSGSYVLSAKLFSDSVQVAGLVEAVRIAGGQTSEGEIEFDLDKYPTEPGSLELVNKTGVPVVCNIEGIEESVSADIPLSVRITCKTDDVSDFQIEWFLNGDSIGEGEEITFSPKLGTHRLDVVASTSRIGTSGSASYNFEAVSASEPGVPSTGELITQIGENVIRGSNIVGFLPDGNVIIVSNEHSTVTIAEVIRNELNVEREYSFSTLGITGTITALSSERVNDSLYKVLLANKNPANVYVYNYTPTGCSLSLFGEAEMTTTNWKGEVSTYENISFAGFTTGLVYDGCPAGCVAAKNKRTGLWQVICVNTGKKGLAFTPGATIGAMDMPDDLTYADSVITNRSIALFAKEGYITLQFDSGGNTFIQNDLLGDPEREELGPENVAKITNIHGAAAIDFRTFITIGDYISIIETFNDLSEPIGIPYSEKIDAETSDIVTSEDGKFAYYIDFDTDELVTLDLMNGLSFKEAGRTKLADGNVDSIAISSSGMNLIVYDQNTTSSLSILRVSR